MKIFLPCWGAKHQDLLKRALLRSLSWSKNKPLIEDSEWLITTSCRAEADKAMESIGTTFDISKFKIFTYPELESPNTDRGQILIKSVQEAVSICLSYGSPMLMATPDFIYGNGTIETFKRVANEPGSCATIANIRVLPSFIEDGATDTSNSALVSRAYYHLHKSWQESPANLYRSGVRIKELPDKTWAVQHYMPSPFYVNFMDCDRQHFKEWHERKPPGFGIWDHVWPTYLLEKSRLRYIGSSDAAVMFEVTDPDMNVPPLNGVEDPKDTFFRNHFHNRMQSQFVTIFRGV